MIDPSEFPPVWRRLWLAFKHRKALRMVRKVDECICALWNSGAAVESPEADAAWRALDKLSDSLWREVLEIPERR